MSLIQITIADPAAPGTDTAWEIWETDAPADYDGFGTFCIMEMPPEQHRRYCEGHTQPGKCTCGALPVRTVLIRSEHWNWQTARYASGVHWHRPSSLPVENVAEFLWQRIMGRPELKI